MLADPAHREVARDGGGAVVRCCSATTVTCCRWTPGRLEFGRGDRPAGGLQARHARAVGLRLRSGRDRDRARGHPRRAGEQVQVDYAPGIRPAQRKFPSMFDMFGGNAPEDPEDFNDEAERQRAVDLAGGADMAIVVLGEWQNMIGEAASRSSLELPGRQLDLLQAVVATGTPVVLLVLNGRPLDLRWAADNVPAIMSLWYPGHPGWHSRRESAVRRRLTGRPAAVHLAAHGRAGADVLRPYPLARPPQARDPLLGRGEYAAVPVRLRAELRHLRVRQHQPRPGRHRPRGNRHGVGGGHEHRDREADEVVQLYIHQRHGTASRPVRELKGFRRISLGAGESRTLSSPSGRRSGATGTP